MRLGLRGTWHVLVAAGAMVAFSGTAEAQRVTYENTVKQMLAERCLGCHGAGAPTLAEFDKDKQGWKKKMKGPRMDNYKDLVVLVNGSDAGALMRRLDDGRNTKDGQPGNMYLFLGGSAAEREQRLDLLKRWVGNWSLKRRNEQKEDELRTIVAAEK